MSDRSGPSALQAHMFQAMQGSRVSLHHPHHHQHLPSHGHRSTYSLGGCHASVAPLVWRQPLPVVQHSASYVLGAILSSAACVTAAHIPNSKKRRGNGASWAWDTSSTAPPLVSCRATRSSSSSSSRGAGSTMHPGRYQQSRERQWPEPPKREISVGIDLGTTNSTIAARRADGTIMVIPSSRGHKSTPSVVAFRGEQVLIGHDALRVKHDGSQQVVARSFKRLLGRSLMEVSGLGLDADAFGGRIENLNAKKDEVDLRCEVGFFQPGTGKVVGPQEITGQLLRHLLDLAADYLGAEVDAAVIGIPGRFAKQQREAVGLAARAAGLKKIKILSEPELALRAYLLVSSVPVWKEKPAPFMDLQGGGMSEAEKSRLVLIADMGGGTFDITILKHMVYTGEMHLLVTEGSEAIGGDNFDECIYKWALKKLWPPHKGTRPKLSPTETQQLRYACKRAKERLSSKLDTTISFKDQTLELSRDEFNTCCLPVWREVSNLLHSVAERGGLRTTTNRKSARTPQREHANRQLFQRKRRKMTSVQKRAGRESRLAAGQQEQEDEEEDAPRWVDEVLCVGGGSQIAGFHDLLQFVLGVAPTVTRLDPETAVAIGAARVAANITDGVEEQILTPLQIELQKHIAGIQEEMERDDQKKARREHQQRQRQSASAEHADSSSMSAR